MRWRGWWGGGGGGGEGEDIKERGYIMPWGENWTGGRNVELR